MRRSRRKNGINNERNTRKVKRQIANIHSNNRSNLPGIPLENKQVPELLLEHCLLRHQINLYYYILRSCT